MSPCRHRQIFDVVRISRRDIHDFQFAPADEIFLYLVRADPTKTDDAETAHDQKFLVFGVMPVVALDNAGMQNIYAELSAVGSANNFRETAARVDLHFERIAKLVLREVGQICGVQLFRQRVRHVRDR